MRDPAEVGGGREVPRRGRRSDPEDQLVGGGLGGFGVGLAPSERPLTLQSETASINRYFALTLAQ